MRYLVSLTMLTLLIACNVPKRIDLATQETWALPNGREVSIRYYVYAGSQEKAGFWVDAELDRPKERDESLARMLAEHAFRKGYWAEAVDSTPIWWRARLEEKIHVSISHSIGSGKFGQLFDYPVAAFQEESQPAPQADIAAWVCLGTLYDTQVGARWVDQDPEMSR